MGVIILDFDGTCVKHAFPEIGEDIGAVPVLKRLIAAGHKLVLFTMRGDDTIKKTSIHGEVKCVQGNFLTDAVNWFKVHDIPLYGIQTNPDQKSWTSSPKAYGHLIIDDTSLGIPLLYEHTNKGITSYINWPVCETLLEISGWLEPKCI